MNTKQPSTTSSSNKRKTRIDFSKLSWGTLRKYQYYFRVKGPYDENGQPPMVREKEAVADLVQKHFEEMKVDHVKLVAKFLRIKKDEKNDLNYNLRKPNRIRAQGDNNVSAMGDNIF